MEWRFGPGGLIKGLRVYTGQAGTRVGSPQKEEKNWFGSDSQSSFPVGPSGSPAASRLSRQESSDGETFEGRGQTSATVPRARARNRILNNLRWCIVG